MQNLLTGGGRLLLPIRPCKYAWYLLSGIKAGAREGNGFPLNPMYDCAVGEVNDASFDVVPAPATPPPPPPPIRSFFFFASTTASQDRIGPAGLLVEEEGCGVTARVTCGESTD